MKTALRAARKLFPSLRFRHWAIVLLPFALCLSLLLSIGPQLEYYLFRMLNNQAPSIYDAAFPEGVVRFPSLSAWLLTSLAWPFLLLALAIVTLSFRTSSLRAVSLSVGVFAFLGQGALDVIWTLFAGVPLPVFLASSGGRLPWLADLSGNCGGTSVCLQPCRAGGGAQRKDLHLFLSHPGRVDRDRTGLMRLFRIALRLSADVGEDRGDTRPANFGNVLLAHAQRLWRASPSRPTVRAGADRGT